MTDQLSPKAYKKANPAKMRIPVYVKAAKGSVILSDLQVVIGKDPINLFKTLGEGRLYKSTTLKHALDTGLLIEHKEDTDGITPLPDEEGKVDEEQTSKKKNKKS